MPAADLTRSLLKQSMAHHSANRLNEAARGYHETLRTDPANFDAVHMLGVIALQIGDADHALQYLGKAVQLRPGDARANANLGTAWSLGNRLDEAVCCYDRALTIDPRFAGALANRGTMLYRMARYEEAADSFGRLGELDPSFQFALGNVFECRRYICDWRDFGRQTASLTDAVARGAAADRPFSFLSVCGSAALQRRCAERHAAAACRDVVASSAGMRYAHERIRIAYVSADYRDHVVLRHVTSLLERQDRSRFHIIGVSLVNDDGSPILQRAKCAVDQFIQAAQSNDAAIAGTLRDLQVDIAVDLTGYTSGGRPGIFARRPAPVQVNYFGYPGTMGASFMDYIIADRFVAPDSACEFLAEKAVRLPDSFQLNGQRDMMGNAPEPTRQEAGLPEGGFVFCAFNNSYKLSPKVFDVWARVMRAVPDAVLWLLGDTEAIRRRLRVEAEARGVEPARLVFASRVGYHHHLARLRLSDVFLDTLPFNAGVTASDALWAGVPVLTCAGEAFAARMAGSALQAVGLPELITHSAAEYEALAVNLAQDRTRLSTIKGRLAHNRSTPPLFDLGRYVRHLEAAFTEMWTRNERGERPSAFDVQPETRDRASR